MKRLPVVILLMVTALVETMLLCIPLRGQDYFIGL